MPASKVMSTQTTEVNAAVAAESNVVRIAEIGNAYGNINTYVNDNGITLVVIKGMKPDDNNEFVPLSLLKAKLMEDFVSRELIVATSTALAERINDALSEDAPRVRPSKCAADALRSIVGKMRIKGTYIHHKPGETYVDKATGETGAYTKDWYELDTQSVKLSYGEHRDAYKALDASAFISDSSSIEDF